MTELQTKAIPFTLLTGFLGSGKTTLLNRMLADPAMGDTAVLINEFGAVGLDHLLVESVADDVVVLASGCVCCSVGDDLGIALESLLTRRRTGELPPFQRVLLETSGIAEPGPIQQRILVDERLTAQLRLDGIVTVVDAMLGERNIDCHIECVSQIALADRLILSKLDLVGLARQTSLIARLRRLNEAAPIVAPPPHDPLPPAIFESPGPSDARFHPVAIPTRGVLATPFGVGVHDHRYETFSIRRSEPVQWSDVEAWLESLLLAHGENILRIKGLLYVLDRRQPIVVQGVQHCLYPPTALSAWPAEGPMTHLTFITRDFPAAAARASFDQFVCAHPPPPLPAIPEFDIGRGQDGREPDQMHISTAECPAAAVQLLRSQRERLRQCKERLRPWHYQELHNPWSPAAARFDSWGILDLCQAPWLMSHVEAVLGRDLILYDSQWLPAGPQRSHSPARFASDAHRCPVEPLAGATVLIHFGDEASGTAALEYYHQPQRGTGNPDWIEDRLELRPGTIVTIGMDVHYRLRSTAPWPDTFLARYFPATSRYIRSAKAPALSRLTLRYPLLNYARLPLWLAHGVDRANNDFVTGFGTRAGFWAQIDS